MSKASPIWQKWSHKVKGHDTHSCLARSISFSSLFIKLGVASCTRMNSRFQISTGTVHTLTKNLFRKDQFHCSIQSPIKSSVSERGDQFRSIDRFRHACSYTAVPCIVMRVTATITAISGAREQTTPVATRDVRSLNAHLIYSYLPNRGRQLLLR